MIPTTETYKPKRKNRPIVGATVLRPRNHPCPCGKLKVLRGPDGKAITEVVDGKTIPRMTPRRFKDCCLKPKPASNQQA